MDPSVETSRVRAVDLGRGRVRGRVRSRARSSDCVTGREGRGSSDSEEVCIRSDSEKVFIREGGLPHHSLHQTSSESLSLSVSCEWRVGLWRVGPKHQRRPEGASCQLPKFFVGHVHTVPDSLVDLLCPLEDCEGGRGLVLRYFSTHFYGFIQSTEFNEAQENRWVRIRVSFSERNGLTCEE